MVGTAKPHSFWRSLIATPGNALITLVLLYGAVGLLPGLWAWAFSHAVWSGSPETCRTANGACWAVVGEKLRLILFGRYPYGEQWRSALAVVLLWGGIFLTGWPRLWGVRLLVLWAILLPAAILLLRGGALGLSAVPANLWGGLPLTLLLAIVGIMGAFPLALGLALARRSKRFPVLAALAIGFIELVRSVPLISILFLATFLLPLLLPEQLSPSQFLRAQLAFILFTSAYMAEALRGGLQSLAGGQFEAADALGFSYAQKMRLVILPQALRRAVPPLVNIFIGVFKDTSLVLIVGLMDLLLAAKTAIADAVWRPYFREVYIFVALLYFGFCFPLSRMSKKLEKAVSQDI